MIHVMYILDSNKLESAMKEGGYRSITALAKSLGLHRNTIHHLLSKESVFPESLEKIFETLRIKPEEVLVKKEGTKKFQFEAIAPMIDHLHKLYPEVTFILFGSRAEGRAKKYADWDIGAYSAKGLSYEDFSHIYSTKCELEEKLPYFVDLINLNRADNNFLEEISKHWIFLSGQRQDWIQLQRKVYEN